MTAQVLSFDSARARFAHRFAARDAIAEKRREKERRRWIADLATWPPRFRALIEPELLDPKTDLGQIEDARRGEVVCRSWFAETPAGEIAARLANYRDHIHSMRTAGSKGWRTQRRRTLRRQADRLVEAMWMYGLRKVEAGRAHRAEGAV